MNKYDKTIFQKYLMNKYDITITEVLEKTITIEANTLDEAIDKTLDLYNSEQIILDSNDIIDKCEITGVLHKENG